MMQTVLAGNPFGPVDPLTDATLPSLIFVGAIVVLLVWIRRKR